MLQQDKVGQYRKLNVETAGKIDLVLMCYEKGIEVLRQAKGYLEQHEYERKAGKLQKGLDIIHELQSSLNFEKGGEIARNLDSLYNYLVRRLIQGDINKDPGAYDEAVRILSELKEAWQEVAKETEKRTAAPRAQGSVNLQQLAA